MEALRKIGILPSLQFFVVFSNVYCIFADTCNHLPLITNGKIQLNEKSLPFMPGESVAYVCNSGFMPDPKNLKITCYTQGGLTNWTSTDDLCKITVVSCNDPGYIENAVRTGNVFTYPHNITYICNEGYKLIGKATRFCSPKGQWLPNSSPSCEAIFCPILSHPLNGKVISSQRRLHSVATYKCDKYFNLTGNLERTCQEDGTWSGDVPICQEITCLDPGDIPYVRIINRKAFHKAGDIIIFKCKYGTYHSSSRCEENGEWSERPPLCPEPSTTEAWYISTLTTLADGNDENYLRKVSCDDPGTIKNGERSFIALNVNSTVTYTCDEGYQLRGTGTLLCTANGKWDLDKLPICVRPLSVPRILGIVFGLLVLIIIVAGGYFFYRWRENKIHGYGKKSKALTSDATDLEEIAGLEKVKKPIPVTVL